MKTSRRFEKIEREDIVRLSQEYLWDDEAKLGRDYLIGTRQLSEDVLRSFRIGYLPEDLDHQLHGRVIMPLFDASGNLVCITSRIPRDPLPTDFLPRYWHEAYEKSFYLYGMDVAKAFMRKYNFAILVEGQIDVMQLHGRGIRNAVAMGGTSLSLIQYATILRYCNELILILDNDPNQTGQHAADKIAGTMSSIGVKYNGSIYGNHELRIGCVQLENAKDPDEFVCKYGVNELKSKIERAIVALRGQYVY